MTDTARPADAEDMFYDEIQPFVSWLTVERGLQPESIKVYERELRALASRAIARKLRELDTDDLRAFVHERGGAASTVARRIAALRSFYGYLIQTDVRIDDPTQKLSRPKVRRGIPRPVQDADDALARLDPEVRPIAVFLRETGLRISEACSVDVDVPAPETLVIQGKGAKERLVPLTAPARAALDALGGRMPFGKRTIQRRFQSAGFTPHQLRHTLGCELAESGADLGEIQDMLGHASPATTRVYAMYSLTRLRSALARRSA